MNTRELGKSRTFELRLGITIMLISLIVFITLAFFRPAIFISWRKDTTAHSPDSAVELFMGYMMHQNYEKAANLLLPDYFDSTETYKKSVDSWISYMRESESVYKLHGYSVLYNGDLNDHTSTILRGKPDKVYALNVTFEYVDGTLQDGNVQFLFPVEKEGLWYLVMGSKDLERELAEKGVVDPQDAFNTMTSVQ